MCINYSCIFILKAMSNEIKCIRLQKEWNSQLPAINFFWKTDMNMINIQQIDFFINWLQYGWENICLVTVNCSLCWGFGEARNFFVTQCMHLKENLILYLELGLDAELSEFNMLLSFLFQEKAKNYLCYLEFSRIIIWENKYRAGENSNNLDCVKKMDELKKVFLPISHD